MPHRETRAWCRADALDQTLTFREWERDEDDVGLDGLDRLGHARHLGLVLLETERRVVGTEDLDRRVPLPQHVSGALGGVIGAAQEEQRESSLGGGGADARDQVRPAHALRQRHTLQVAGPDDGHPVGHQDLSLGRHL